MSSFVDGLIAELPAQIAVGRTSLAVIGLGPEALTVVAAAENLGARASIFDPEGGPESSRLTPWAELAGFAPTLVVIASDAKKERLLRATADVLDHLDPLPHVVMGGLGHQTIADGLFEELEEPALVPSYATGHPYTRVHLYDCLRSAAAHERHGAIVELGAFKGGTSVWLAKASQALGLVNSKVIAFDAWDGFPPRRSLLDLYEHPRCVFRDLDAVRRYTEPYEIELVVGDIAETAPARLADEPVLLAFVDTDNYSGARAALEAIVANLIPGGAIVLDHYFTTEEYVYTVGERMAANEAVHDAGLFHLHGTGVFVNLG